MLTPYWFACMCALMLYALERNMCCVSDNKLGARGGAVVAEAMKGFKQLTCLDLSGMPCVLTALGCVCYMGVVLLHVM